MDASIAARALVRASAGLSEGRDVPATVAALLEGCRAALDVDAIGILVRVDRRLELLSFTAVEAIEPDLRQVQLQVGPCVDAGTSGLVVAASGPADLAAQWPQFAASMSDAGYRSIHASPLRWQGSTIGAMGLYCRSEALFGADEGAVAQAFADITASLVASDGGSTVGELTAQWESALGGSIVIEQAKGVLAQQHGLGMAEAYDLMLRAWTGGHESLAEWSSQLVREADPT